MKCYTVPVGLCIALAGAVMASGTAWAAVDVAGQVTTLDRDLAARGRALTALMYDGDLQPIWDRSSATLQATLQDIDTIRDVRQQLLESLGLETTLVEERTVKQTDLEIYVRTVTFERTADSRYFVQWAFDLDGAIQGFTIRPAP
jgi:hypothetical protein